MSPDSESLFVQEALAPDPSLDARDDTASVMTAANPINND